jgi:two-component system response regulator HydG
MARPEPRILVVDDERDICDNLRDILGEFGYAVDTTIDPLEALDLVDRETYDIALLDLKMPGLDGVELCRRIRQRQSSTVGLIVTAYADPAAEREAAAAGAYRVLAKPVDARLLMGLIETVLEQPLVLIVDDDRDLCESLRDVLTDEGFRCGIACSAGDFERQLTGRTPQVVVIDLRLADSDGIELLAQVRNLCPESRTILITAHHEEIQRRMAEATAKGADAVCLKPFDTADLVSRIRGSIPGA